MLDTIGKIRESVTQTGILLFIIPILFFGFFFPKHVYMVYVHDMSVWKGGGMGMFSSLDHPSKRELFFFVSRDDELYEVVFNVDQSPTNNWYNFKIQPHPRRLDSIVDDLLEKQLYVSGISPEGVLIVTEIPNDTVTYPELQPSVPFDLSKHTLDIELWKMYDVERVGPRAIISRTRMDNSWEFTF